MPHECMRESSPGLHVIRLPRDAFTQMFITVSTLDGEKPAAMFRRLDDCLRDSTGVRVVKDVFGLVNAWASGPRPDGCPAGGIKGPVTWVEDGGAPGSPVAGMHVHAVAGASVEPIRADGCAVGTVFEDAHARWCLLGNIHPEDPSLSREKQTRRTFEMMEEALALAGMDFSHVVRTWFYLNRILSWYDGFNRARTSFFTERRVFDGMVPASTGIGGANSAGAALVADVLAIRPTDGKVRIQALPSPLQCPALDYNSSFSRAVEIATPEFRHVLVSGTASIEPGGATAHVADVDAQVALTMEVVEAILKSRGMGWKDATRAIGYFKRLEDAPAFDRYCAGAGLPTLPIVISENDVCRDDLLFEIEMDAAVPA